VNKSIIPT